MSDAKPVFELFVLGQHIPINQSIIFQWTIMVAMITISFFLTRNMSMIPKGKQIWAEYMVESVNNLVKENMGKKYLKFAPYIGTLAIFLLLMNLFDLFGFRPPTTDYSVTLGLAIISFIIIQVNAITKNGIINYIKAFFHPFSFMFPLNIIERLVVPISLSLRLFGNTLAAVIIIELLYQALNKATEALNINIPFLQAIIPIPFHLYFSIFDGVIQMVIFVMLTMIFIKITAEH
ncbi:ATP synthase subunit a [Caloramator mitchellensis]|uniref:ATP synthase subunit a n=1 Tax=Caloramator mitchellensis TaxID=908809 RepID=A0A0R3JZN3_CALMK|nr:F0F1 ATP synthase subunit A [Caloramator mitchellensis]KRQ87741.1 ATP synthase subunit a [Caloramator mitchellensis]